MYQKKVEIIEKKWIFMLCFDISFAVLSAFCGVRR